MKKKKNIIIITAVAVTLAVAAAVSLVFAYMFKKTEKLNNNLVPAEVSCSVVEKFENNVKSSIKIENTGNTQTYIRVYVMTYWQDSKGNIVQPKAAMSDLPKFTESMINTTDWFEKDGAYYYKNPVNPESLTNDFLKSGTSVTLKDYSETEKKVVGKDTITITYEYHQVVEIIAEAIQADPKDAVQNSWGVTVNSDKTITS